LSFRAFFKQKEQSDPSFVQSCVDFEVAHLSILMLRRLPYPEIPTLSGCLCLYHPTHSDPIINKHTEHAGQKTTYGFIMVCTDLSATGQNSLTHWKAKIWLSWLSK